ncbi:hypothetical protein DERF_009170, partial [Dermatophagoides farinae]
TDITIETTFLYLVKTKITFTKQNKTKNPTATHTTVTCFLYSHPSRFGEYVTTEATLSDYLFEKYQIKDMRQEKIKNDPVNMINQSMIVFRNMIDKFLSDVRHIGGATTFTSGRF